jgi:hypothetical protein
MLPLVWCAVTIIYTRLRLSHDHHEQHDRCGHKCPDHGGDDQLGERTSPICKTHHLASMLEEPSFQGFLQQARRHSHQYFTISPYLASTQLPQASRRVIGFCDGGGSKRWPSVAAVDGM